MKIKAAKGQYEKELEANILPVGIMQLSNTMTELMSKTSDFPIDVFESFILRIENLFEHGSEVKFSTEKWVFVWSKKFGIPKMKLDF